MVRYASLLTAAPVRSCPSTPRPKDSFHWRGDCGGDLGVRCGEMLGIRAVVLIRKPIKKNGREYVEHLCACRMGSMGFGVSVPVTSKLHRKVVQASG
jgi:hypothetical protein